MLALTAATIAWLRRWAKIEVVARGMEPDNVFVTFPLRAWWFALLLLPPIVVVVAWVWTHRADPTGEGSRAPAG
jgi:hypothetical protein